jgi:uroporphyrin-III C-methyltransferase / precorrin-2 dehydrogenase / sirohydrochlorin ferrochelatase
VTSLYPVFLKLSGRRVLLVGGGTVAAGKLRALLDARARVRVVAPAIAGEIAGTGVDIARRPFEPDDLDGVCYVVAAAPADVNRTVAREADARGLFVNAVDDVANATAYAGAVIRRDGVAIAISTDGEAPALAGLLREGIGALLPGDLKAWMTCARDTRREWLRDGVPIEYRRPLLLDALVDLYRDRANDTSGGAR